MSVTIGSCAVTRRLVAVTFLQGSPSGFQELFGNIDRGGIEGAVAVEDLLEEACDRVLGASGNLACCCSEGEFGQQCLATARFFEVGLRP